MLLNTSTRLITSRAFSHIINKSVGIVGVPFSKGQRKNGVQNCPEILRKAGLVKNLNDRLSVKDYGDLSYKTLENMNILDNMRHCGDFLGCNIALIQKVNDVLKETDMCLVLGGDHAIGFGSVAGHLLFNPNTSLIWIDAHPDINLNITSGSGNTHGMPVAFLIQELRKFWKGLNIEQIAPNCLPTKELIYIGLRDIDPKEAYILSKLGITYYAMDTIDKYGMPKIIEMALDAVNPKNKLHVSFDIDALDVNFAPSTGTAVVGGLTLREGLYITEALCETNRVQVFDLVELNPHIGTEGEIDRTIAAGMEIIKSACGYKRSGNFDKTDTFIEL